MVSPEKSQAGFITEPSSLRGVKAATDQAHAFFSQENYKEAEKLYRNLLATEQDNFLVWGNLGICLKNLAQYEAAVTCLKRADELRPRSPGVLRHLGHALTILGRDAEALSTLKAALQLKPDDFNNVLYYAAGLCEFGMNEEALRQLDAACALDPRHVEARWYRTDTLLRLGRFSEGWREFELRWQLGRKFPYWHLAEQEKTYASKRWAGESLNGKTILVYEEQGFGDTILCSRYIPLVKARGGPVIVKCRPDLHQLFSSIDGADRIVAAIPQENIDYHVPIMSLPGLFDTDISTIPPPPSLQPAKTLPEGAKQLIAAGGSRFKIGIVWSGSPHYFANSKRAVSLRRFLPLAEIPGVQLYSLQKGPPEAELSAAGAQGLVLDFAPFMKDFSDTAALLKTLDLVIMTDSSVAHLAGSLGVPVWNLLQYRAYWLYFLNREDSPWYPSMRLFRQPAPEDWDGVFKKVAEALARHVKESS